jgi:hypothetical protein
MNPDALGYGRHPHAHTGQTTTVSSNPFHGYQNVTIGNGMMTVRVNPANHHAPLSGHHAPLGGHLVPLSGHLVPLSGHHAPLGGHHAPLGGHLVPLSGQPAVSLPSRHHVSASNAWKCGGTIISEVGYRTSSGQRCEAIFLGLNKATGKWELFRGKMDPRDVSPADTSKRETREETSHFFHLSSRCYSDHHKVTNRKGDAHFYVVRINPPKGGIQSRLFDVNRAILSANHAPSSYLEMSAITRISIPEAIASGITNTMTSDFVMRDVYGKSITICDFDAKMISRAIQAHHFATAPAHNCKFISSWDDRYAGGRNKFLDNTATYKC